MSCPICSADTKVVPAGISRKTKKPYRAFIACTNRDCDYTAPLQSPQTQETATRATNEPMRVSTPYFPQESNLAQNLAKLQSQFNATFDKFQNNQFKIVVKIQDLEQKIAAIWAACIEGTDKEESYKLHSIPLVKPKEDDNK